MPDTRQLLGEQGRPAKPKQILMGFVSMNQKAPATWADPLYVIIPDFSHEHFWKVINWPACHGTTLPARGAECLLINDDLDNLRCVWWDGVTSFA